MKAEILSIGSEPCKYVLILAGDHVYKMDYRLMLNQHVESGAEVTVGALEFDHSEAKRFGVMELDAAGRAVAVNAHVAALLGKRPETIADLDPEIRALFPSGGHCHVRRDGDFVAPRPEAFHEQLGRDATVVQQGAGPRRGSSIADGRRTPILRRCRSDRCQHHDEAR